MPEDGGASVEETGPRWRDADVERAIAAAERAGLRDYRIEIACDGTITIVVGGLSDTPEAAGLP